MQKDIAVSCGGQFSQKLETVLVPGDVQAYRIVYKTPYDLTDATFSATALREDGSAVTDMGTTDGDTGYYTIKNSMYSQPGIVTLRLTISSADGAVLTAKEVLLDVAEGVETDVGADDRVPVLNGLISRATEATAEARQATEAAEESANVANMAAGKANAAVAEMDERFAGKADKDNGAGGFVGGAASCISNGAALGKNAQAARGGAIGESAKAVNGGAVGVGADDGSGGGAVGYNAKVTSNGGAVGRSAKSTGGGGAVGQQAEVSGTQGGFAGGNAAKSLEKNGECGGAAVGHNAVVEGGGGAVGYYAYAGNGFAGGQDATTFDATAEGQPVVDAIQLGTGNNPNPKTLQIYDYQLLDADGNIPTERLKNAVGQPGNTEGAEIFNDYREPVLLDEKNPWLMTGNMATGLYATANGSGSIAAGDYSHADGHTTQALEYCSHAEGEDTKATGRNSHAEGCHTIASGAESHAEGYVTHAEGSGSHVEGRVTTAKGYCSHAEGLNVEARGYISHAEGEGTAIYSANGHVHGCYNVAPEVGGKVYATIVGNGENDKQRSNAYTLDFNGNGWYQGAVSATGSNTSGGDYAEMYEWADGNPDGEDRRGLFVTLDGDKIRLANENDTYILGITSAEPSVLGEAYDYEWQGKYERDIFGKRLIEEVTIPAKVDDAGNILLKEHTETRYKIHPAYDKEQVYVSRLERNEWAAVGTHGKLVVVDDGTCRVNEYCNVSAHGIGTAAKSGDYRVLKRIDGTHIRVVLK